MTNPDPPDTAAPETMECPKCGHLQNRQPECIRCGIVVAKYRPLPAPESFAGRSSPKIYFNDGAKRRRQIILLVCLLGVLWFVIDRYRIEGGMGEIRRPPGVAVRSEPRQIVLADAKAWTVGARTVVPLARFSLEARVLGKENYSLDAMADISPIDLALGWGPMSDQQIIDRLSIVQGSRRYMISCAGGDCPSAPVGALLACSSNMHMLPSTPQVEEELDSLRPGDIVDIKGYLVGVQENGRWVWVSSLSRTDTGDGACEIVWVEEVRVHPPPGNDGVDF